MNTSVVSTVSTFVCNKYLNHVIAITIKVFNKHLLLFRNVISSLVYYYHSTVEVPYKKLISQQLI